MNKAELYNSKEIDEIFDSISPEEANRAENRMLLAAKIKDAMDAQNISKLKFAELMGKNPSVITKWLSGTHNFTSDTLSDIGNKLSIKLLNVDVQPSFQNTVFVTSTYTRASILEQPQNQPFARAKCDSNNIQNILLCRNNLVYAKF